MLAPTLATLLLLMAAADARPAILSCKGAFAPHASEASLKKYFGAKNVRSEAIQVGEGFTEPGTVVFPNDKHRRVEILWSDPKRKRSPARVHVRGNGWRTPEGITRGTTLRIVEKHNRKPFVITGFSWDYGGRAGTWRGGRLEHRDSPCRLSLEFSPGDREDEDFRRLIDSVSGEHEFSSGHPSMQKINPIVDGIELTYN
jgi:hypothetical protein